MSRKRIDSLQALRAIAAVLVVLFHMDAFMPAFMGFEFAGNWFRNGEAGVDIFFVLSGFIIYYSVKGRQGMTRGRFLEARFIRLYPIYWLVLGALIVAELVGVTSGNPERLEPFTMLRSVLLLPSSEYVLNVSWTLAIEVIFYAIFALFFFLSERAFFAAMLVWCTTAVAVRMAGIDAGPSWLSGFVLYSGVAEFGFGVLIARFTRDLAKPVAAIALVAGIGLFVASLAEYGPLAQTSREFGFGIPSALIVFGAYRLSPPTPKWLTEIGESSYVLYLVHGVVLSVLLRVVKKLGAIETLGPQASAWLVAALTVVVAYMVHRWVERPLLGRIRVWQKARDADAGATS
ncbi:MAG: acyltransferase family protein [Polyangiales bacterium]